MRSLRRFLPSSFVFAISRIPCLLRLAAAGLAGLLAHALAGVAHAFALIWLGRAERSNARGGLPEHHLVVRAQVQARLLDACLVDDLDAGLHAVRQLELHGVRQ